MPTINAPRLAPQETVVYPLGWDYNPGWNVHRLHSYELTDTMLAELVEAN